MELKLIDRKIDELTSFVYNCSCGRVHNVKTKSVIVEEGALSKIFDILQDIKPVNKVLIIADENTYSAAAKQAEVLLLSKGVNVKLCLFSGKEMHADEYAVGKVLINVEKDIDIIVAVGSGTINDIARFVSSRVNIPYVIVATAPSMDGYASTVSPLMVEGFKKTFEATYPSAIIGDIDVLKNAPDIMVASGFGDMLGKITALSDWILSSIVEEEYFCPEIFNLMLNALKKCIATAYSLRSKEAISIKNLTEGLILSGIAMQLSGNSRPASGAEHHMSHYWEMQHFMRGENSPLHGIKVGVAVSMIMEMYNMLFKLSEQDAEINLKEGLNLKKWELEVKRCYGPLAKEIIEEEERDLLKREDIRLHIRRFFDNKHYLMKNIGELLTLTSDVKSVLSAAGAPVGPDEIGISREDALDGLLMAKELRHRYTVLRLLDEIGMLEKFSCNIIGNIYSK